MLMLPSSVNPAHSFRRRRQREILRIRVNQPMHQVNLLHRVVDGLEVQRVIESLVQRLVGILGYTRHVDAPEHAAELAGAEAREVDMLRELLGEGKVGTVDVVVEADADADWEVNVRVCMSGEQVKG